MLEGARDWWERYPYHFQKWAVEDFDGFVTSKRTADGGVDGRLYSDVRFEPDLQSMAIEVKGGENVTIADWEAPNDVLEREEALMAGLTVMEPLGKRKTQNVQQLMSEAVDSEIESAAQRYARMQIASVPGILPGNRLDTPTVMGKAEHPQQQIQR